VYQECDLVHSKMVQVKSQLFSFGAQNYCGSRTGVMVATSKMIRCLVVIVVLECVVVCGGMSDSSPVVITRDNQNTRPGTTKDQNHKLEYPGGLNGFNHHHHHKHHNGRKHHHQNDVKHHADISIDTNDVIGIDGDKSTLLDKLTDTNAADFIDITDEKYNLEIKTEKPPDDDEDEKVDAVTQNTYRGKLKTNLESKP